MNKPWVIWSFSVLIALLVFGSMAAITQHTLGLEKKRAVAEAKAELEERTRIALWRMDTAAAGILAEENNRPSWHFRDVDLKSAMLPSPLNLNVPENVKLHFQVSDGTVTSPQVNGWIEQAPAPVWGTRQSQITQGVSLSEEKKKDWASLQKLLNYDTTFKGWQTNRNVASAWADNNLGVICAVVHRGEDNWKLDQPAWDAKVAVAQQQRAENSRTVIRNDQNYQGNYNAAEKAKRTEIVQKTSGNRQQAQTKSQESQGADTKPMAKMPATKGKVAPEQYAKILDPSNMPAGGDESDDPLNKPSESSAQSGTSLSSLIPIWIGDELMLVREVQDASGKRIQGVWLDAKSIRDSLIMDIDDLLPDAQLKPVRRSLKVLLGELKAADADDPMAMAALPWRLSPGEVAVVHPVGWTAMRKTLAVAWIGALLAALAAVILLRGVVKLSERRASFVSSVTHELRTPLTTFSLYSDMLSAGMVKDEEKQKDYLYTLKRESARLTHLVENVLAYSRIEKGSARARVENIKVGELIDRICERLRTRADEAGMELHCAIASDVSEREIKIDTTAVEQILFNLVDNASKYAADETGGVIHLKAFERGKMMIFQVSDEGPGVSKSERKKLFRAFHKSAQEAAHTKPGVGLGLALCRRLARALGGDLKLVDCEKGACFELSVQS